MSDIRQDIRTLKTNIDKKTDAIISKSQTILDNVKTISDLVSIVNTGQNNVTIEANRACKSIVQNN